MKAKSGEPVARVEQVIRSYIDAQQFRERHPAAFVKWQEAERMLWVADSSEAATTIGHLCREAHQAFATSLLGHHPNPEAPSDPALTKNRIHAVLADAKGSSDKIARLGEELNSLWSAVVDLVQRQEHGGQKAGDPLTWEDSRRVVFLTLVSMAEIDRLLRDRP